jgi:hypothetical protein
MAMAMVIIRSMVFAIVLLLRVAWLMRMLRRGRRAEGLPGSRTFDNLVEFPSVKPDTAALGAVINFNSLTIGHNQVDGWADGTFHDAVPPFLGLLVLLQVFLNKDCQTSRHNLFRFAIHNSRASLTISEMFLVLDLVIFSSTLFS